jgi:hypothetical protein
LLKEPTAERRGCSIEVEETGEAAGAGMAQAWGERVWTNEANLIATAGWLAAAEVIRTVVAGAMNGYNATVIVDNTEMRLRQ